MALWTNGDFMRGAKAMLAAIMVAGLFGLTPAVSMAQEVAPEHLALAREYIDLTDRGGVFETSVVETGIETLQVISAQNPELFEPTNEAIGVVIGQYNGRKGELLDQFARVYAVRFSIDELKEIVAFYETPTGQKLSQANSELNTDLQRVMQVFNNNLKQEFLAKVRAELRSKGIEL
jgi:hypothetical protein